jgi:hypothetical protein
MVVRLRIDHRRPTGRQRIKSPVPEANVMLTGEDREICVEGISAVLVVRRPYASLIRRLYGKSCVV